MDNVFTMVLIPAPGASSVHSRLRGAAGPEAGATQANLRPLADILAEDRQKYLLQMVMSIGLAHAKSTCTCVVVPRRDIDARCARWRHSPSACIAHLTRHVTLNPARPPSRRPQTMSSEGMCRGGLGVERQILVDSARRPAQPSPNQTARLPRRDTQNEQ
ncbi:hypothetical protein ACCO45_012968 [Purpureocillium lilacinum]|uniref:Uncharacterized protein n=1 Tax=Purpureocillium lilacinum TaxID=33203 RepID=A0ACC4D9H5_PURLI